MPERILKCLAIYSALFPGYSEGEKNFQYGITRNSTPCVAPFLLHSRLALIKISTISEFIDRKIPALLYDAERNDRTEDVKNRHLR